MSAWWVSQGVEGKPWARRQRAVSHALIMPVDDPAAGHTLPFLHPRTPILPSVVHTIALVIELTAKSLNKGGSNWFSYFSLSAAGAVFLYDSYEPM